MAWTEKRDMLGAMAAGGEERWRGSSEIGEGNRVGAWNGDLGFPLKLRNKV